MSEQKRIVVALAGNPNSGKTTIFNALTGSRQHVGNYPGVTVEKRECLTTCDDYLVHIIDLPGTYSLNAFSTEEMVTRDFIINEKPDVIIDVMDSSNLERNLYLCLQFQELGVPVIGALNMTDEAEAKGIFIDSEHLGDVLGIPMVKTVGTKGIGLDALLSLAVRTAVKQASPTPLRIRYGREVERHLENIESLLNKDEGFVSRYPIRWLAIKLLERDAEALKHLEGHSCRESILEQVQRSISWIESHFNEHSDTVISEQRYAYIHGAVKENVRREKRENALTVTDKLDAFLLNKWLSLPVFLLVVWIMFQATFALSEKPMEWLEMFFGWLGGAVGSALPESFLRSLLVEGVIGGVGGMLVFLPNIILLFLGISILEDSGYMSRAAFIMDKIMHKIGLHGQSFIPLLIGFGCSVPAILGTRTLRSDKDRITTVLIIPLMSCGARLPVYTLLISVFFSERAAGNILFLIYLIGIVLAISMAFLFRKFLFKGAVSPFVMELPPYRMPTARGILTHIGEKTMMYLKKAGTIILAASVIIWFMTSFPRPKEDVNVKSAIEQSFAGQMGKAMAPVLDPLGFNWKIGIALITGLAAKETVVSTLGTIYKVDAEDESSLRQELKNDPSLNPLVAFCLMLFILIYIPCLATLAVIRQELGSMKWVFFSLFYSTGLAWILTFLVYRVGMFLGVGV
jgi:ferrous iron transport protein B